MFAGASRNGSSVWMLRASSWTHTSHSAHTETLPMLLCDTPVGAVYGRAELSHASLSTRLNTCTSDHSRDLD